MAAQSSIAFRDYTFHSTQPTHRDYYSMASSSYAPREGLVPSPDLASLAHHFGQQTLRHDPRSVSMASGPYHQVQHSHANPSHHQQLQSHQASVRSQRQANSRLQCEDAHAQLLASLVDRMIASGQCSLCHATVEVDQPAQEWHDETMGDELDDDELEAPPSMARLSYRRSTDLTANGQGYVAKSIRVRKKNQRNNSSTLR